MLIPLTPDGTIDGETLDAGAVWTADGRVALAGPADLLVAYPGRAALPSILG